MKTKLQITFITFISLFFVQAIMAQLTLKNLGTPLYNGQGQPSASKFIMTGTTNDSITFTQQANGLNFLTKGSYNTPVLWYATSNLGFAPTGAYTVESKVAVTTSMKNGYNMEMQALPGKRFQLNIDTTAIYNMTYYPSVAKEVLLGNLDNRGMHTYRVAVDANDLAHIYRDGVAVATADVDGLLSTSPITTDVDSLLTDQFFEDYITSFSPAFKWNSSTDITIYPGEAALKADLSGNWDISMASWTHIGIDTVKANVKVGNTSVWFNNGTTGSFTIKRPVTVGKYKFSFWSKTQAKYMAYKGSIAMDGTGGAVLVPSTIMVNDNQNYNYKQYVFDVPVDGTLNITFFNGWGSPNPGWASMWFDDLRLTKVDALPYVRFGKDTEFGVTDMTIGSFTYDLTGAYAPDATGINDNVMPSANLSAIQVGSGMLNVRYTLANNAEAKIQLMDLNGRMLSSQTVSAITGENSTSISVPTLKGIYLLRLIANEKTATIKVALK
jgi:hypothetical protein